MAHFHDNALIGASGQGGYQISRSLRFNSADSAYLNRTPASAGNRKTWTWSGWIKFSSISVSSNGIFEAATNSSNRSVLVITGNSQLQWFDSSGGSTVTQLVTSQVFRDFSAWYHIVLAVDTTQATSSNRVKIYVNGSQVTAFGTATYPSQNFDTQVNAAVATVLGAGTAYTPSAFYDGYLTEINFIDGQALTPSSFGETDTITGVWKPKKYAGTYGTNGFYLNFSDNSGTTSTTLGKDSSGNGNNWTPNNFSVTAGAGNDSLIDTPTPYADGGNGRGNYCTLNPLDVTSGTFSNGNLDYALNAGRGARGTIFRSTGKWYFEAVITAGTNPEYAIFGIQRNSGSLGYYSGNTQIPDGYGYLGVSGSKYTGTTSASYGNTFTTNDVIGVAYDLDAGKVWFSKNGTWQASGDPAAGTNAAFTSITAGEYAPYVSNQTTSNNNHTGVVNFGQRSFSYTPPSGFVALNTQNLPEPSIKKPSSYMDVKLYTGTGATQSITGLGFSPDLVWTKGRGSATYNNHLLYDSVRGTNKILQSNQTAAESTLTTGLTSFNSDGFTIGAFDDGNTNANTYVAWCWDESATPGFDIVTYTGDGNTGRTVAHGLGVKPSMVILKARTGATSENWVVWHQSLASESYFLRLNATDPVFTTFTNRWTAFSSTTITLGNNTETNGSTYTYVAYLWSEVAGFSKFGSYFSNGSSDGPYVHCGFRPKAVWIKKASGATNANSGWYIFDSTRSTYNTTSASLRADLPDIESTFSALDFTSAGFKIRVVDIGVNGSTSGDTYIFCAWAETPAKYALAR